MYSAVKIPSIQDIKKTSKPFFDSDIFKQVWLIGSFARQRHINPKSDIDFLIEYNIDLFDSKHLSEWSRAIDDLEKKFGRPVQFIPSDRFPGFDLVNQAVKIK